MRVLGISGSLRRDSHNTKLLRAAEELLPAGVAFELYDELETVPPYNEDRDTDDSPLAAVRLRDAIAGADAVLFATPEYNGSVPGQLKNAVDWASRPHRVSALWGKPVAVVGASTGMFGAVWAQAELRKVLKTAGARVVETEVAVGKADSRFDADGVLVDDEIREQLAETIELLLAEAAVQAEAPFPARPVAA
jgi:chromate reductase, NAD(P)H dehydrogenase (quinone)